MDESRFGLMTITRRCLTARGVKPIVPYQHRYQNFYLFGAYGPRDGDHFTLELPQCNSDSFQIWLDAFSQQDANIFKIVILDNGAFHKAKDLNMPSNIELLFLPPYNPELNPAEQIWRHIKDQLANVLFKNMEALSDKVAQIVKNMTAKTIKSITGWKLYTNPDFSC
jgi:hypothetical protein